MLLKGLTVDGGLNVASGGLTLAGGFSPKSVSDEPGFVVTSTSPSFGGSLSIFKFDRIADQSFYVLKVSIIVSD